MGNDYLFNINDYELGNVPNPLPMQYLGSKLRLTKWILSNISREFPSTNIFVDLFAGTGSVSIQAKVDKFRIIANDIQPYSHMILKSLFSESRNGISEIIDRLFLLKNSEKILLSSGRRRFQDLLKEEENIFKNFDSENWEKYKDFCESTPLVNENQDEIETLRKAHDWNLFLSYYANTYFGVEQCFHLDSIRELAEDLPNQNMRIHLLAATISVMTYAVSSTTHLAQYLKPSTKKNCINLIARRKTNIIDLVVQRLKSLMKFSLPEYPAIILNNDYCDVFSNIEMSKGMVFYADPPYFKEHYSRYYHILDTYFEYDFPFLTFNQLTNSVTKGRYRQDRIISDFGLKSKVESAFNRLFSKIYENSAKLALSYANSSLVNREKLLQIASENGLKEKTFERKLMHSGQGQPRSKHVTEYLFLFENK